MCEDLKNKTPLKILLRKFESKTAVKVTFNYPDEEHDELRSVDLKLVSSDLPRPNLAEEDNYGGGRVKISAAGASTTATRSRQ